ncbi:MAG: 50S ribosomal protein L29 [bacterium]
MKKAYELRELSLEDLESLEIEKAEELMQLRMKVKMRQVDNPLSVRNTRRELARIKTAIHQKRTSQ